jgi:REP element-mobilizing transposase RayT
MNRGAARRHIFVNDVLKQVFLNVLEETKWRYKWDIYAFCIMGNHYHLLICTPEGNLSDGMRFLNSRYAREFNKIRAKDGPIFKSRFKSLFISSKKYLLNVTRYIHLNPIDAGITATPEEYKWSSYKDFIGENHNSTLLTSLPVEFSPAGYISFVQEGNSIFIKDFYNKQNLKMQL